MRDTRVLRLPAMGSVRVAFDADNPGRWASTATTLATGMMTEVVYDTFA